MGDLPAPSCPIRRRVRLLSWDPLKGSLTLRELGLIDGYRIDISSELPEMSFRKMFGLALKTWPYMRPMLRHLLALLAFGASGLLIALVTGFVGTDLITNKVLLGEKLQPVQALVLFVDDSYVTTNPERLGQGKGKGKGAKTGSNDSPAVAAEPELTLEQRRTVRDRLLLWTVLGGALGAIPQGARPSGPGRL